jgi:hypothetical protein
MPDAELRARALAERTCQRVADVGWPARELDLLALLGVLQAYGGQAGLALHVCRVMTLSLAAEPRLTLLHDECDTLHDECDTLHDECEVVAVLCKERPYARNPFATPAAVAAGTALDKVLALLGDA